MSIPYVHLIEDGNTRARAGGRGHMIVAEMLDDPTYVTHRGRPRRRSFFLVGVAAYHEEGRGRVNHEPEFHRATHPSVLTVVAQCPGGEAAGMPRNRLITQPGSEFNGQTLMPFVVRHSGSCNTLLMVYKKHLIRNICYITRKLRNMTYAPRKN